jgi:thymidylate synthase
MHLHLKDLRTGYVELCQAVLAEGKLSSPRGQRTVEVIGCVLTVDDPRAVLPKGVGRKVAPRLAALEALQLIGGYSDVGQAKAVSKALEAHEDMGRFHGAYGPRVLPQLEAAVHRLTEDPESRRAVINVWDPLQDLFVNQGIRNYPCTTQLQFFVRDGALTLYVTMRANDAWRGLAYDAFTFAQLQLTVARCLGVEPGPYVHHATSMHLYEDDWDKVAGLRAPEVEPEREVDGIGHVNWTQGANDYVSDPDLNDGDLPPVEAVRIAVMRARMIGAGILPADHTDNESWYHDQLAATPSTGGPYGA